MQLPNQGSQQMGLSLVATDVTPLPDEIPARTWCAPGADASSPGEVATLTLDRASYCSRPMCRSAFLGHAQKALALTVPLGGACTPFAEDHWGATRRSPSGRVTCALAEALSAWLNETVRPEADALLCFLVVKLYAASLFLP